MGSDSGDSVVSGEGFAGRGGSNYTGKARGESSYQRYDFQQLAGWAEQILPLSLLLLVVFIRQHLQDMGSTKWIGFRCIRGLIVEGSAGGGSSNRNARGESLYERCDIQQLTGWAEHILPSSLLLLVAFIRQHLQGLPIILQIRKISAPTTVEVLWINVSGAFSCNCTTFAAKDVLVVLN